MVSIYEDKRDIESNKLRKLLLQIDVQIIGNNLSTKSTIQEEKKMKIKTKRRRKFSINN